MTINDHGMMGSLTTRFANDVGVSPEAKKTDTFRVIAAVVLTVFIHTSAPYRHNVELCIATTFNDIKTFITESLGYHAPLSLP